MRRRRWAAALAAGAAALFVLQVLGTHWALDSLHQGHSGSTRRGLLQRQHPGRLNGGSSRSEQQRQHDARRTRRPARWQPAIIVFAYNRAHYLNATLHSLAALPGIEHYHVAVSQVRACCSVPG